MIWLNLDGGSLSGLLSSIRPPMERPPMKLHLQLRCGRDVEDPSRFLEAVKWTSPTWTQHDSTCLNRFVLQPVPSHYRNSFWIWQNCNWLITNSPLVDVYMWMRKIYKNTQLDKWNLFFLRSGRSHPEFRTQTCCLLGKFHKSENSTQKLLPSFPPKQKNLQNSTCSNLWTFQPSTPSTVDRPFMLFSPAAFAAPFRALAAGISWLSQIWDIG